MNLIYQNYGWNVQSVFALLKPKPKALITENSTLIKHGMLGFFSPTSMERKMRYFFLFDRALVIAAPMKKKFRVKIYVHLRAGVELVEDPQDNQFRLNVTHKGKGTPIIMFADSIKEKNAWIREFDNVLWKIRDGDYSLEAGSSNALAPTPKSSLSRSETDISKISVDPRTNRANRKSMLLQSNSEDQSRARRSRSNTTGGAMTLDLSKTKLGREKSFRATQDSALQYVSDDGSDSEDDDEEKARLSRKREKRARMATATSPREQRAQAPHSARGNRSSQQVPISPRGDRSSQQIPVSPRDRSSRQIDLQRASSQQAGMGAVYSPPSSMNKQQPMSNSMTDLTQSMQFVNLNPPSPMQNYSQPQSPQAFVHPQQQQPMSPRASIPQQQPQQQPQQPMMYAVQATQDGQQGTYYMDSTAYAHYIQQLQVQQMQLLQQQQMLQQHQTFQQQSVPTPTPLLG